MMKTLIILIVGLFFCISTLQARENKPKNVLIIMADDLGFNDISFRGSSEIPTPNIDALFYNGVVMNRFYTPPLCTPSRGSLMTGRYPFHIGLQNNVAWNDEPWGLGLDQKLTSEFFKEAGYSTHLVGKWHLGFCREQLTPLHRGFDTHFGYLGPWTDYFDHTFQMFDRNYSRGLDLRRQSEVDRSHTGEYATDMYTQETIRIIENQGKDDKPFFLLLTHLAPHAGNDDFPLQAKQDDINQFGYIADERRKTYAAMVKALDDSIANIIEALTVNKLMDDTIVVFYSDNGGPTILKLTHPTTASNYPLRGQKGFNWEGGIRTDCVIYSPSLPQGVIRNELIHVVDLLPTLGKLAGADICIDRKIDGVDQSEMILTGKGSNRDSVITIDNVYGMSSVIYKNYKFINGTFTPLKGLLDAWFGQSNLTEYDNENYASKVLNSKVANVLKKFNKLDEKKIETLRAAAKVKCLGKKTPCNLMEKPCIYDIINDPCEENNIASDESIAAVIEELKSRLDANLLSTVQALNRNPDPQCDPALHGGVWTWWLPDLKTFDPTSFQDYAITNPDQCKVDDRDDKKMRPRCFPINSLVKM